MVSYLKYGEIDTIRWNKAVADDPTYLPYGFSWWLDAVCPGRWDGLVFDDYRAVMALPREPFSLRRPFSSQARPQVQRPPFTQQCGPFGNLLPGDVPDVFGNLPSGLNSFVLPLTENVVAADVPPPYTTSLRTNFVLDLSPDFDTIRTGYHKSLRRKIRKHSPAVLLPADAELVVACYQDKIGPKAGLKAKHFTCARALIHAAMNHNAGHCYQLQSETGELLATGFFPNHNGRIINLMPVSTALGYEREGMALLIDEIIKRHRGPGNYLDFEGSDIPGVARFFSYFGPERRPYLTVQ
ncbi:hypothetical protein FUA23_00950 [Neolewinella aurantiaca]|uniref:BioF2-like acetyltransferase domain-containing protein n=1 Tax=Neolewinella aurantiaca TaxID=2602767 RepID=A0A5C7FUD3_9BACT|nr:hypothetical protein [Neolewinella aurantiaca]TXF91784.1 hypothetical protein FUA23_00950 [Neolewinella aurantiaca]